ncbi:MAG: hypothetical protein IJQ31_10910 [Thermoguttaceae bacterium]|nr:hypothetical protein [Thermoguttaceae bacterium]
MYTSEQLEDYAERFARENSSPFEVPTEFDLEFSEEPQIFGLSAEVASHAGRPAGPSADSQSIENGTGPEGGRANASPEALAPASNTGLTKYHFPRNWGGYDGGCEASFMGEWDEKQFEKLSERLDHARQAADDGKTALSYVNFGGFIWSVRASGAGIGFFKYKFVLESHGVKLYIHSNPKNSIPPVCVRFGFECLVRTDLFSAVETLRKCLYDEGFKIKEEKISRVDMQVMIPVNISEFVAALQAGPRVCTRCRGGFQMYASLKTGKIETITISSENCELCIYDKHRQVLVSDPVYYDTFCKEFLGDEMALVPKNLTRVEFRFKRGFLRRYGVDNFDDLQKSAYALVEIASRDWFRILARDKVRGSENEIPDAPIWAHVRAAFEYYFYETDSKNKSMSDLKNNRVVRPAPSVDRLIKQAMGCLSSAASFMLEKVFSVSQLVEYYTQVVTQEADETLTKVSEKQIYNQIVRGFTRSKSPDYTTLDEIQEGLAPVGFPEFWEFS